MDNLEPAKKLIKQFEGCNLHSYQDSVGIWTIGYGTTLDVYPGQVITQEQADSLLLEDIEERAKKIATMVTTTITNNQFCALVSLAYNVGLAALFHSKLLTKLNKNRPKERVALEFLKWNHAGGKVLKGLTRRREAERALFLA